MRIGPARPRVNPLTTSGLPYGLHELHASMLLEEFEVSDEIKILRPHLESRGADLFPEVDLSPKLRQPIKSQNSMNGELDSWVFPDERSRVK
jgi:hypothetical protein